MKTKLLANLVPSLAVLAGIANLHAQGTAFTFQGRLNNNGATANGSYDLQFAVFDAAAGGSQIGSALTTNAVAVFWPLPSTGNKLQQNTTSVSSVDWISVTGTIQDNGLTKTFIVKPPTGNCLIAYLSRQNLKFELHET